MVTKGYQKGVYERVTTGTRGTPLQNQRPFSLRSEMAGRTRAIVRLEGGSAWLPRVTKRECTNELPQEPGVHPSRISGHSPSDLRWPVGLGQLYVWKAEAHGYQGLPKGSVRTSYHRNQGYTPPESAAILPPI